ncbi:restriction endonuclease subunit S [Alistipes putredinis]|jgi:type I restriction enzyme S subunit|uniref:restriction endonuclease subunit S n=1 Tax=Alistipes putredinis TaxID=28117 RepID=UPI00242C63A8|nr:restriction endonuclease subunit S [Alistipes putredinis]MCS2453881.1 restriction endonuclease subunit S [Bacteroides ovatus]
MDTKKLRQKILDLAIHGKLVPQDPNDEPASVLLERIKAEKEHLVKEGKIKRSKKSAKTSDTPHYENVPFEVPSSWVWTTLSEVGTWQSGGTPSRSNKSYYGGNIPWLKTGDLNDGLISNIPESITEEAVANSSAKINPTGSVLIAMYGATIGKLGILTFPATTNQACCACIEYEVVAQMYLFYFLLSQRTAFIEKGGGGAQPNISKEIIVNTYIPLPPLSEQHRIVAEIKKWFTLIDQIEQGKTDLQTTIKQTKSKILDLAIHGKLAPQDPNDEPAIELLKRINPDFTPCDNGHYPQLPDGWCYSTIKEVFIINPRNKVDDDVEVGFVPMANITDGYNNTFKYEKKRWGKIKTGFTHFADGDIAVAKISPCLENRKSVVLKGLPNGIGAGTTELHVFRSQFMDIQYGLYFFKSDYFISQCVGSFNGVVGQQRVSKNIIEDIIIAIPPINEQKRIVYTISKIFAQLDIIMGSL